jgi:hypothetical protein
MKKIDVRYFLILYLEDAERYFLRTFCFFRKKSGIKIADVPPMTARKWIDTESGALSQ